jgi:hypothetical protein
VWLAALSLRVASQGGEVTVEQLLEQKRFLEEDRDHEREERNYFQLERDKINTFWEISKKELEDRKVSTHTHARAEHTHARTRVEQRRGARTHSQHAAS